MSAAERGSDTGELYETRYERGNPEDASTAVAIAVAEARGVRPDSELPLANSIDPDALDSLFSWPRATDDWTLEFTHADVEVAVSGDGTIQVREP